MTAERVGLEQGNAPREPWAWVVRGEPGGGESEGGSSWVDYNLANNVVTLGWGDSAVDAHVAAFKNKELLKREIGQWLEHNWEPDWPQSSHRTARSGVWQFCNDIYVGDIVVLHPKGEKWIAIGEVIGPAERDKGRQAGVRLYRPVRWLVKRKSQVFLSNNLWSSIRSQGTIFRLGGDDVSRRINFRWELQDLV